MLLAEISPDIADQASSNLLQYGAIGACLIFAILALVALFRYTKYLNDRNEQTHEKYTKRIDEISENRIEASNEAVEAIVIVNQKIEEQTKSLDEMHKTLNTILRNFERINFRGGRISNDRDI